MKTTLFLCVIALSAQAARPAASADAAAPGKTFDTFVRNHMAAARVGGLALARIENGRVAWIRTYGEAAPGRPVTPQTPFNVASLTKPVFAAMVLHQVAAVGLDLDESLAAYWVDPDLEGDPRVEKLTARLVLSHQTGLPNWRGGNKLAFQFDPGQGTDYSGEGYEYLRRALEKKTGKSLPELMAGLQRAAGMTSASFGWRDTLEGRVATGTNEAGEAYDMAYLKDRGPAAASSLFCSVEDYARFAAWVGRGADLPKALFEAMQKDQATHGRAMDHFGLGWRVAEVGGTTVLAHDGREDGVRTQVFVVPGDQSGFVCLTNSANGELLTRPLATKLMPRGGALIDALDENAWAYACAVPDKVQPKMLAFIARSPSFTAKLLYGADVAVIRRHLPEAAREAVGRNIDTVALGLLHGRLTADQVLAFFQTMGTESDAGFRLNTRFDAAAADTWRKGLAALADAGKP